MPDDLDPDRRKTFDEAAGIYHEARPRYPEYIFDRLVELLPPRPLVIEIGPGTGQATEPMLRRGARVRAIEIGPRLAVQLAQRLGGFLETEQLEVIVADYESIEPDAPVADVVLCATAYHWISPAEQLTRPRRWLAPMGHLAVIDTMQVASPNDGGYFAAAQTIYERYGQATGQPSEDPDTVTPGIYERMTSDPSCVDVRLDRCRWDQTYDASSYRALLNTYSGTLAMTEPSRSAMVGELVQLVEGMGGTVTRPLVITLATCRFVD